MGFFWSCITNEIIFTDEITAINENVSIPMISNILLDDINQRVVERRQNRIYVNDYEFTHNTRELSTYGKNK